MSKGRVIRILDVFALVIFALILCCGSVSAVSVTFSSISTSGFAVVDSFYASSLVLGVISMLMILGVSSVTVDMGGIEIIPLFLEKGTVYEGLWQNEWLVHDTEVKDYNTTITAVNVLGESATKIVEFYKNGMSVYINGV